MKFTGTAGIYHVVINADFGVKSLTAIYCRCLGYSEPVFGGILQGWNAGAAEQFNSLGMANSK
jgi:hypothetical protein